MLVLVLLQVTIVTLSGEGLLRSGIVVHSVGVGWRVKASMAHVQRRVARHTRHLRRHAHAHTGSIHAHAHSVHRVTGVLHVHWRGRHRNGEMAVSCTLLNAR